MSKATTRATHRVLIDRASPRLLITLALTVCGASLIVGHLGGLYWLAGAPLGALLAAS
jgi:hypothetical protein